MNHDGAAPRGRTLALMVTRTDGVGAVVRPVSVHLTFILRACFSGVQLTGAFYNLGGLKKGGVGRRSDGHIGRVVVLGCNKFD